MGPGLRAIMDLELSYLEIDPKYQVVGDRTAKAPGFNPGAPAATSCK